MRRGHLLLMPALFVALAGTVAAAADQPPNVVLILIDDLGWKDLGCTGSTYYETPNLDALAAGGMRFTQAYAACAVCSPTRAAVMTGEYPARIGITDWIRRTRGQNRKTFLASLKNGYVVNKGRPLLTPPNTYNLPLKEVTIAERLKDAHYATCYVGKWHLGDRGHWPKDQGFDENFGGCAFGSPPSYFDPYASRREPQGIPTLEPRDKGEYLADREADEATAFIAAHQDEPFFLSYCSYEVHTPIQGKKTLTAYYKKKAPNLEVNAEYAAMVAAMDHAVGQILDALKEHHLRKNTLVIFTSDNGGQSTLERIDGPTDTSPLRSGKGYAYEGGLRVPLIVSWPGVVEAGTTSSAMTCSIDLVPTICDALDVAIPERAVIDGISLWPHITSGGTSELERDTLIWHFPHYRGGGVIPYSVIHQGNWKLIKRYEGPTFELFNLEKDPYEQQDAASERPDLVKALDRKLSERLKAMGAKMPRRKSDQKRK